MAKNKLCWFIICFIAGLGINLPAVANTAYVAIIIDDIGYNLRPVKQLAQLPFALTFAVLPDAESAFAAANELNTAGKEMMIHLPMQGRLDQAEEQFILHSKLTDSEYSQRLFSMLDKIPNIVGANNHQGSIHTKEQASMQLLMQQLKNIDNFYFVDSLTSPTSVAWQEAEAVHIPTAKRDVFIDHIRSREFIWQQLKKLSQLAQTQGFALGIAHPYPETIQALYTYLPSLDQKNIKLLPVSKYIAKQQENKID